MISAASGRLTQIDRVIVGTPEQYRRSRREITTRYDKMPTPLGNKAGSGYSEVLVAYPEPGSVPKAPVPMN